MKVKTSITLSDGLLREIDRHTREFGSRSGLLEAAARGLLARLAKTKAERRDLEIIDRYADALNVEAEDVLGYQVPL
jgi:metal-responsive CopG/Arc/MetJ family transcriptional regulator